MEGLGSGRVYQRETSRPPPREGTACGRRRGGERPGLGGRRARGNRRGEGRAGPQSWGRRECLPPGASVFPSVKWAWAFGRVLRSSRPQTRVWSRAEDGPPERGRGARPKGREPRPQVTGFLGEPGRIGRSHPGTPGSQGPPSPAGRSPLIQADAPRVAADPSASGVRCPVSGGPSSGPSRRARGLGDSAWGCHRPCSIGGGRGTRRLRAAPSPRGEGRTR